jgi:hypothetical protein
MLSLAGWGHEFACPPNRAAWLANAVNSLHGLTQQFYLSGVDINYEVGAVSGVGIGRARVCWAGPAWAHLGIQYT